MSLVSLLGDATPRLVDFAEPPALPARSISHRAVPLSFIPHGPIPPWPLPPAADTAPARSRFEALTLLTRQTPPKAGDLLSVLLGSTIPLSGRGCQVLQPLWAGEAIHRAFGFARLVQARARGGEPSGQPAVVAGLVDAIARDLAAQFRELETGGERDMRLCSGVLRDVVTGLRALFGGSPNITIKTKIEDVSLPAYKRRALVLAAAELVNNALLHAFRGRRAGRIEVDLTITGAPDGTRTACLRVADNGIGFTESPPNLDRGVASGLACLLEADLAYDRSSGWTIAEIAFPVPEDCPGHG